MRSRTALLALVSLLLTVALGAWMRGMLAGWLPGLEGLKLVHEAHSHLGWYGVVFPLAWLAWGRLGVPVPGPRWMLAYAGSVGVATWAFGREGYGFMAIVASTWALLTWLGWAFQLRAERGWAWLAIPAILGAAAAIPGVAATIGGDPAFAQELVQGFMTLFLLGVALPAALASQEAPAPPRWAWTLGLLGAAAAFGPFPLWPARLAAVGLALLLGRAGLSSRSSWDLRGLWVLVAAGIGLVGGGQVEETRPIAIAGLHLAILGPVLWALSAPVRVEPPAAVRLGYFGLLGLLSAGVAGLLGPQSAAAAALGGAGVAISWWLLVAAGLWRRAEDRSHPPSNVA